MDANSFCIKRPESQNEWNEYHRIRREEIFDRIDGVEYDYNHPSLIHSENHHFILCMNEKIIGTFHFELLKNKRAAIRTIAISGDKKNKGYGSQLLKLGEEEIKKHEVKTIHLHANPKAYGFYKRNNYVEMSFEDASINEDTIDMGKNLL